MPWVPGRAAGVRVTSPPLWVVGLLGLSPVAGVALFGVGAAVAFGSLGLVAGEVHGLEGAVVVSAGCDGCDVVGGGA